ncbi:MAG: hypothetical protein ACHQ49_16990 [Elusimicrobiota bacterium]
MNMTLVVIAALLPSLAAAAPSFESQVEGSLAAFQTTRPDAAAFSALARRPAVATVSGGFNGQTASLTLDRRAWTIVGGLNGMSVKVAIDQAAKTVAGSLNGETVALTFVDGPDSVSYKGAINGADVEYSIDWQAGIVDGSANGSALHLEFNVASGAVDAAKSYVNGAPVGLTLDAPSGRLTGTFGGKDVGLTLVNADLSDFLQNLYLFLKR